MHIKTAYSTKTTIAEVVADIKNQLIEFDTKILIFFASSIFEPVGISKLMYDTFSNATVFGCSTAGEIISGKMLKNAVVAMAFNSDIIEDAKIAVVENIKNNANIKGAFKTFQEYFKEPMSTADYNKYVGVVLIDGLSNSEEKIMDKIGDQTNFTFIGGSAGDDLKFSTTYVYYNGAAYSDSAILAVLKSKVKFDIIKTQSFKVLDKQFVATKVDSEARKVIGFDGKPAAEAYADALGVSIDKVADYFITNPVGLIVDDEIFVRSPQQLTDDGIVFYCNILEGMTVSLLESSNIIKDTTLSIENKLKELGSISGLINFHCILRTVELEQKGQTDEYGKIFTNIPSIGFSTYGEEYLGHMNQTSTILVFK